jgi:hypothetical protein
MCFEAIDDILSDNANIRFYHTSNSGMIDLGNYESLNGRGKEYNERLKAQKENNRSKQ